MPRHASEKGRPPDPALLILTSLADAPKHGYAMIEDIVRFAGVRLGPGTLYGAITRLEESGLIAPLAEHDRRRPYELTGLGREVLADQLAAIERLAAAGLKRLSEVR